MRILKSRAASRFNLHRSLIVVVALMSVIALNAQNSVGIGTSSPDGSALLDVTSSSKGVLIPRMTQAQRKSISSPKNGLLVYDSSTTSFWFYQKNKWQELGYGTNSADSTVLFGQQSGSVPSYNGDPSGSVVVVTDSSGYFYDDGGPAGNYSNNATYFFAILTSGNVIGYKLQVLSNSLENPYDSLFIFSSGDYTFADTLLGNETGSYTLPNNPVVIKFKSNFVNPSAGFAIRWDAIFTPAPSNTTQPLVAGWHYEPQKLAMHGGLNLNNNWHADSSGLFSLNYGYANKAKGNYSLALGAYTSAFSTYSSALGYGSVAKGAASAAIGYQDTASGTGSTALGYATAAKGDASLAFGYYSVASNEMATAGGDHSTASGFGSIALGREAKASGSYSIVLGSYSEANGTFSAVLGGNGNLASAPNATTVGGIQSIASGDYSITIGSRVYTNGKVGSVAIGDINLGSPLSNDENNQMLMRFGGGYKLYLYDGLLGMAINPIGYVGIGTDAPDEKLHVNGNIKCISLTQTSDSRLKKNIRLLNDPLHNLTQLTGYSYQWKNEQLGGGLQTGLMAQEVKRIFPHLVSQDKNGMLSINYTGLIPVMIESIKSQQQQIDELTKMMEKLINK